MAKQLRLMSDTLSFGMLKSDPKDIGWGLMIALFANILEIRESRDLTRKRNLRNIYYLIISSNFTDDFDDLIRSLKMETDVNEVCLVEAPALVAMVDQKLRAPLSVSLGPDEIRRIFSASGIVTVSDVLENSRLT